MGVAVGIEGGHKWPPSIKVTGAVEHWYSGAGIQGIEEQGGQLGTDGTHWPLAKAG